MQRRTKTSHRGGGGHMSPKLSLSFAAVFALVLALTSAVLLGRSDAAGAVGIGGTCAGIAGLGCDAGLWCELEPGTCNRADAAGLRPVVAAGLRLRRAHL